MRRNSSQRTSFRLWSVLSYLLVPYALLCLIWKGIQYRPYFHRWRERFGFLTNRFGDRVVWVHAVSVGEVRSAAALIRGLIERYPEHSILVTTMTPTGGEQVRQLFGRGVDHCYLPYDLPDVVARFLDHVQPSLAVIAETEFWPNLFAACNQRRIPLLLVNVRVSASSLAGYLRIPKISREMFRRADLICAQTRTDAQRLRNLGVDESRLHVTGNLKFDVAVPESLMQESIRLRSQWGEDRLIWVAGSTHANEESKILDAFVALRKRWSNLLLVLVPRDPERFSKVARLVRRYGLRVERRSNHSGILPRATEVVVGDTMGELQLFYAAADLAFVGASLVMRGGHNILEPGAVGVPVIFGPHMFNFEDVAALALDAGAGLQVYDSIELIEAADSFIRSPALRAAAGRAAQRMIADNQGSLEITLDLIARAVSDCSNAGISSDVHVSNGAQIH